MDYTEDGSSDAPPKKKSRRIADQFRKAKSKQEKMKDFAKELLSNEQILQHHVTLLSTALKMDEVKNEMRTMEDRRLSTDIAEKPYRAGFVVSPINPKEITGLHIWPAKECNKLAATGELDETLLGDWHHEMFKLHANRARPRERVPVFCLPSYKYLTNRDSIPTKELPSGVVCWRALLRRYVDEAEFIAQAKKEEKWKSMFSLQEEVGAFKDNVACYANVNDIYKIILSNLDPSDWDKVELNKAERVVTNIGNFSMLYFSKAKWFHFVPSYNGRRTGLYEEKLDLLLTSGHTVDIGKFQSHLTGDTEIVGAWTLDIPNAGQGNGLGEFAKAVENDIRAFMSKKRRKRTSRRPGDTLEIGPESGGSAEDTNVFFGGVTTKETEYDVSRILANVIHSAVWYVGKILVFYEDDWTGYKKTLKSMFKDTKIPEQLLNAVQIDLLSVEKIDEVCAMSTRAKEILSILISAAYVDFHVPQDALQRGLACNKALGKLIHNLHVLTWDRADLEALHETAWLAGITNTTIHPP